MNNETKHERAPGIFRSSAVLLLVSLFFGGVCFLASGQQHVVLVALGITLPPALLTLAFVGFVSQRWPMFIVAAVAFGTTLRMGMALLAVLILGKNTENRNATLSALAEWTTGFYLMILFLETFLLSRWLLRRGKSSSIEAK